MDIINVSNERELPMNKIIEEIRFFILGKNKKTRHQEMMPWAIVEKGKVCETNKKGEKTGIEILFEEIEQIISYIKRE